MKTASATIALATLLTACGGASSPPPPRTTPTPARPPAPGPVDVDALLSQMTLAEKVGQMALVDRQYLSSEADITTYFLGGILSGGGSAPAQNDASGWADMYDRFQARALS